MLGGVPDEAIAFREPTADRFLQLLLWNACFSLMIATVIADRLHDRRLAKLQLRKAEHSAERWRWWPEWENGAVASVPSAAPFRWTIALFLLPVPAQACALFLVRGTIVSWGALTSAGIASLVSLLLAWPSLRRFFLGVRWRGVWRFQEEPAVSDQEPVRLRPGHQYRGRLLLERGWLAGMPLHLVARLRCGPIVKAGRFSRSETRERKASLVLRLTAEGFAGDLSLDLPSDVEPRPWNVWRLTVETRSAGVIARFDLPVFAD